MDSLGSATDSEAEEESFSDCCSVLSAEESGPPPGGRGRQVARPHTPRTHRLPPRASHGKEPFRRLTPKRPAPQPPSRPPPPTTPVPSISPVGLPGSAPVPMTSAPSTTAVPCTAAELSPMAESSTAAVVPCSTPVPDTTLAPVTVHQEVPSEPAEPTHSITTVCEPVQPSPEAVSPEASPPDACQTSPSQPTADSQVVTHTRPMFFPRPMSPPRVTAGGSEGTAPPTPQRSAASQVAAKNFTTRMIRLIDDESDSDTYQSDSYEEHFVFQAQPPPRRPRLAGGQIMTSSPHLVMASPLQVVTPQAPEKSLTPQTQLVMTSPVQMMASPAQNVSSASQVMTVPAQVMPSTQVVTQVIASPAQQFLSPVQQSMVVTQAVASPGAMTNSVKNGDVAADDDDENIYEFYGNLAESLSLPATEGEAVGSMASSGREVVARRDGGRPLMHSASAPAVPRPLRRHQRAPGLAVPPPLDHLSEEEVGASDYEEYEQIPRPSLQRTDSLVTVAHLYEDLLVSSRFRLRVTLTNLTAVVVMAALVVPNTSTILYTAFRYSAPTNQPTSQPASQANTLTVRL